MPVSVKALSARLGLECFGDVEREIESVANISNAQDSQLTFLTADKKSAQIPQRFNCVVITTDTISKNIDAAAVIISGNPQLSFVKAVPLIMVEELPQPFIHPSAVIADSAKLDPSVCISAGVVIEDNATIEQSVRLAANVIVGRGACIGEGSNIDSNVTIYPDTVIGRHCRVSSGAVIGSPGFGIVPDGKKWLQFPQLGRVVVGDHVDIGANCCIDRGALDDTVIASGVKLDNLIQIAHNVRIGENTVIAACTGIAGSAVIGRNCRIGGRASIQGHITIADNVVITTCTFVNKSLLKPGIYSSSLSAQENSSWLKNHARLHRLDKLSRQLSALDKQFKRIAEKGDGNGE